MPADTPATKTAWVFDASLGTFLDGGDAHAVGCGGKRWQSETRAYTRNTAPTVLRMPPSNTSGPVTLKAALASCPAGSQCHVEITASLSLAVDPAGDNSACAAPLPPPSPPGPPPDLPQMMKVHGCLQSFAWLLCLFPGAMAARYKSLFGLTGAGKSGSMALMAEGETSTAVSQ